MKTKTPKKHVPPAPVRRKGDNITNDCLNRISLTSPREPLPPLLRACLRELDPACKNQQAHRELPQPTDTSAIDAWRKSIWETQPGTKRASITTTFVEFLTRHGPLTEEIDRLARIFGRSLRVVFLNDMVGMCGWAVSRPDGTVESKTYPMWEAPEWLVEELGFADCAWSDKWQMYVPADGAYYLDWSDARGWGAGENDETALSTKTADRRLLETDPDYF